MKRKFVLLGLLILLIFLLISGYFLFRGLKTQPNLEGFYNLTKEDPLFYSPFLESKEFRMSLERLKEAEKQLKEVSIESYIRNKDPEAIETSYYIKTLREVTIFPYQFLGSLILVNQATDDFLENPSIEKGHQLLVLYEGAANFYLQEISGLINVIEAIEEKQRKELILLVDSQTNLDIILVDYKIIRQNAYALKEEIDQRKKCLEGGTDCSRLKKEHSIDYFLQLLEKNFSPQKELKPEVELVRHTLHVIFPEGEVKDPYKIESSCWESPDNNHWIYLIYQKSEGESSVIFKLAEQNYYIKTKIPPQGKREQAIAEKGLDFSPIIETHHYNCTNLIFYPHILTLDFLKKQIKQQAIKAEQLIKEREYTLLIQNQFGLLPPAINKISSVLNFHAQQVRWEDNYYPPLNYLYGGMESAYSLFYLPYARSVWRLDEKLRYLSLKEEKVFVAEADKRFYTLSELKDMGYSKVEIKKFHINLIELLEDLLEFEKKDL